MAAMEKPILQVALDFMHLKRAIQAAKEAVLGGADWVEAGTPLVKSEGVESVRALRRAFPNRVVVADLKVMDTGALEVEIAAKAGANVITVMGVTDDATIKEAVKAARRYGAKIMVDLMRVTDKPKRAKELEALGVDYLNMHVSIDEQMIAHTPLEEMKAFFKDSRLPVAVAGGRVRGVREGEHAEPRGRDAEARRDEGHSPEEPAPREGGRPRADGQDR